MQMRRSSGTGRPGRPVLIAERWFRAADLPTVRAFVASQAAQASATEEQAEALVVVANELAVNAVTHGGFEGRMRLWRGIDYMVCEVHDRGSGMDSPATAGTRPPDRTAAGGRGLWLVRRLADSVEIESGPGGTTVAARLALRPRRANRTGGAHRP